MVMNSNSYSDVQYYAAKAKLVLMPKRGCTERERESERERKRGVWMYVGGKN
jgi:hypothetical protein